VVPRAEYAVHENGRRLVAWHRYPNGSRVVGLPENVRRVDGVYCDRFANAVGGVGALLRILEPFPPFVGSVRRDDRDVQRLAVRRCFAMGQIVRSNRLELMISLVTGKIGSGKTLYCVGMIIRHIAQGGTVYTNIRLNWVAVALIIVQRFRRIAERDQLRELDLAECEKWHDSIEWGSPGSPVLVVLDEIHLFFNARDWAKTSAIHRPMLSFLSQSRKTDTDVVFIAQVATTLEKQFRVQCEWEYYCRNIKDIHVPLFGTLPLNRMLLVQKDVETDKATRRQILRYDRGLWKCYDTRSFLDAQMREAEKNAVRIPRRKLKRAPLLSRAAAWSIFLGILAGATSLLWQTLF
jgi:hypothetical protein